MNACSKFSPNIFDKKKCQNCFKIKTCHLDQASEKNQSSKHIIRCSFLFISTECHSTVNNFKTRKWQRRWFVLYSDGELTYALDESLLTLPQNRIILKNCEKVYLSPEVHEYAITIVHLDKLYYIRANYADEKRKWFEDLCSYANYCEKKSNIDMNLNKCIVVNAVSKLKELPEKSLNEDIKKELVLKNNSLSTTCLNDSKNEKISIQVQPKPRLSKFKNKINNLNQNSDNFCDSSENLSENLKINSKLIEPADEKVYNIYQNIDYVNHDKKFLLATNKKCISYNDIYKFSKNDDRVFDKIKLKNSDILNKNNYQNLKNYLPEKKFSSNIILEENYKNDLLKPSQINLKDAKLENKIALSENKINSKKKKNQNLNKSLPDLRIQSDNFLEENQVNNQSAKIKNTLNKKVYLENKLLSLKTGWLMRKGQNKQWFKHWFVLKDTLLTYYRDQSAEMNSLLDGILDLALIKEIKFNSCFEFAQVKYYPFQITMWDEKQHELASMSFESREAWLKLILDSKSLKSLTDFNANNIQKNEFHNCQFNDNKFSNKIKEKIKKESDSESSDSNAVVCQVFNGDQIPSSPPLNRNAVSRMKLKFKDVGKFKDLKNNFKNLSIVKTNSQEQITNEKNLSPKNDSKEFISNQPNYKFSSNDFVLQTDSGLASSEDNGNLLNSTLTLNDYLSDYDIQELADDKNLESNKKKQLNQNLDQNIDLNLIKNSNTQFQEKLKSKFKKQIIENSEKLAFELSHKSNKTIFDEELKNFQNLLRKNKHSQDKNVFNEENEINNIKNTIVELHKFCLSIINEIQITHSDVTEMKRNLIQKDLIGFLLGNQFINGSTEKQLFIKENLLDTFTNQIIDNLMEKLDTDKNKNIETVFNNNKKEPLVNKEFLNLTEENSSLNTNECNCKKQIDSFKIKNEQLEKKLITSFKTVQRLNTELKESHANYDHLEIAFCWMQTELKSMLRIRKEEYELMQEKINYLTSKLVQVEKAYRENLSKFSLSKS